MLLPKKDLKFPNWFYKYPRADSFDLYRNSVGDAVLRNLLPKSKLEELGKPQRKATDLVINAQNREYVAAKEDFYNNEEHLGVKILKVL